MAPGLRIIHQRDCTEGVAWGRSKALLSLTSGVWWAVRNFSLQCSVKVEGEAIDLELEVSRKMASPKISTSSALGLVMVSS